MIISVSPITALNINYIKSLQISTEDVWKLSLPATLYKGNPSTERSGIHDVHKIFGKTSQILQFKTNKTGISDIHVRQEERGFWV